MSTLSGLNVHNIKLPQFINVMQKTNILMVTECSEGGKAR